MKYWNMLSDDAQDFLLIAGFVVEAWLLFGVMA